MVMFKKIIKALFRKKYTDYTVLETINIVKSDFDNHFPTSISDILEEETLPNDNKKRYDETILDERNTPSEGDDIYY